VPEERNECLCNSARGKANLKGRQFAQRTAEVTEEGPKRGTSVCVTARGERQTSKEGSSHRGRQRSLKRAGREERVLCNSARGNPTVHPENVTALSPQGQTLAQMHHFPGWFGLSKAEIEFRHEERLPAPAPVDDGIRIESLFDDQTGVPVREFALIFPANPKFQ
jgi:hypothetical protein